MVGLAAAAPPTHHQVHGNLLLATHHKPVLLTKLLLRLVTLKSQGEREAFIPVVLPLHTEPAAEAAPLLPQLS